MARRRSVLIDIDGVLVTSWRPLAGAVETLADLRSGEVPFALVTNTTSTPRAEIAGRLIDAGFPITRDDVLTTVALTADYLRAEHPGARVQLLNSGDVRDDLAGIELVDADGDVIVMGGAGPELSYEAVNRAFERVVAGAPLVTMNPMLVWQTSEGLQLDGGAYVRALAEAAGVEPIVTGKPSPAFFAAALEHLGAEPAATAMVGDDLRADVLGAQACGLRGVQVRTGKFRPEQLDALGPGDPRPDEIIDSFADLPAVLAAWP
jgi:HAD superfamily hydrolase (TIGR01458 family)